MHMKTIAARVAAVLASVAFAASASAHEGHGSCGEGARVYVVPQAQSGMAGETVSAAARDGSVDGGVAASHAALCDPKP